MEPDLSDSETITFADADIGDTHSASATAASGNTLGGSMSAMVTNEASGASSGTIQWNYTVSNSATQHLAQDETTTETFNVTIADNNGGTVDQVVTVTVTGTNDVPVITAAVPTLDIVVSNSTDPSTGIGNVVVLSGTGDGTFTALAGQPSGGPGTYGVALGDVDGDGRLDIVASNYGSGYAGVLINNGDGTFDPAQTSWISGAFIVGLGDVNNDGMADIAVAQVNDSLIGVLLATGGGAFAPAIEFNSGGVFPYSAAMGDLNGDGNLDLVAANAYAYNYSQGAIGVLLGNGDGTFSPAASLGSGGQYTFSVALGDVNGDGNLDVAATNTNDNTVSTFVGQGDGTFALVSVQASGGTSPDAVTVADLNGDGFGDLVVVNEDVNGHGAIGVLISHGDGTFDPVSLYSTGGVRPLALAIGDLNGDGAADVVTTNALSDSVAILLGVGDGTLEAAAVLPSGGSGPTVGAVALSNIVGAQSGDSATLSEDHTAAVTGELVFTDVDRADTHIVSPAGTYTGSDTPLGTLSATLISDTTGTGSGGRIGWTYSLNTPAAQYLAAGETKVEAFDVSLFDGTTTVSKQITITIQGGNDAPIAAAVALTPVAEDTGARIITAAELLTGVSDVDGPAATITALSIQSGAGSLTQLNASTWAYTSASNDDTAVTFAYTTSDGQYLASSTASLDITPVNDRPAFAASPVSLSPAGTDIQVNTSTDNDQRYSTVSALADGGFVVTWTSLETDGSRWGVYAQRYNATGSAAGSEFRVNSFTANDQIYSSSAALPSGGFVVTWSSLEQEGQEFEIYMQRYDEDGTPLGGEVRVNTETQSRQVTSAITALANGGFVITWESSGHDGDATGIYGQRFNATGQPVGTEFRANTYTTSDQMFSTVSGLAGGGFVVTWSSIGQDGSGYGVYGQRFDAAGQATGPEFQANSYTASDQVHSSVAALTNGGYVVTWSSLGQDGNGFGIYGQRYDANGATLGGEFLVNATTTSHQYQSSVVALPDGGFVVAWNSLGQDGNGWGVYGQHFDANGAATGGEVRLNAITQGNQLAESFYGSDALAVLNDGRLVATWTGTGNEEVFARVVELGVSVSVVENATQVMTLAASDVDSSSLTYSITGGADAAKFQIDATTGALSFIAAPNFEAPASTAGTNTYAVTVQVSDGNGGTDTLAIAVTVANADDPTFITSNGGGATAAVSIAENSMAVTTVTATDEDTLSIGPLAYTIVPAASGGGADGALFSLNSVTGALSFISAPNFEAPVDANGDNVYEVMVQASEGVSFASQLIRVTVTNVNEAPTAVVLINTLASTPENGGAVKVADIAVTDDALGSNVLSLSGSDAAAFSIQTNGSGGKELWFNGGANFEAKSSYAVTVNVDDPTVGGTPDVSAGTTLSISNVDEAPTGGVSIASFTTNVTANTATLTTTNNIADVDGITVPVSYQWRSSSNGGASWTDIAGAAAATFTPDSSSIGKLLQVAATYSDPFGQHTLYSPQTAIVGDGAPNSFTGTAQGDLIIGLGGGDTINGFVGSDTIDGAAAKDTLALTATSADLNTALDTQLLGIETVSAAGATSAGVTIDLSRQTDGFSINGSSLADIIIGSASDDAIAAGNGDDTIKGFSGSDTVDGGTGSDTLLLATTSADLNAAADNRLVSIETVSAEGASVGVTISLANQAEGFHIVGSDFNDRLAGGSGSDTFTGGSGADTFAYTAIGQSGTTAASRDVITDFNPLQLDIIDLSVIDAIQGGKNDAFSFNPTAWNGVGNEFTGAGQLRYQYVTDANNVEHTIIAGNVNNNLAPDFQIDLVGHVTLTASNFNL